MTLLLAVKEMDEDLVVSDGGVHSEAKWSQGEDILDYEELAKEEEFGEESSTEATEDKEAVEMRQVVVECILSPTALEFVPQGKEFTKTISSKDDFENDDFRQEVEKVVETPKTEDLGEPQVKRGRGRRKGSVKRK